MESCVCALLLRKGESTESALRRDAGDSRREGAYTSGSLGLVHDARRVTGTCSGEARGDHSEAAALTRSGRFNNMRYKERRNKILPETWGARES